MDLITAAVAAGELAVSEADTRLVRIVAAVQSDFLKGTRRDFERKQRTIYCRGFGRNVDFIYVTEAPIVSVAEIRIDGTGVLDASSAVPDLATGFWWETDDRGFQIHRLNSWFPEGPRVAMVRFTAGYENAEALPADLTGKLYAEVFTRYSRGPGEEFASYSVPGVESFSRFPDKSRDPLAAAISRYSRPA